MVSIKICVISLVSSLFIQNEFDIKANIVFYQGRDRAYFEKFNDDPVIATNKFSIGKLIFGVVVGITVAACIGLCVAAVTTLTVKAALISISAVALPGIIFRAGLDVLSQENSSVEDYIFEAVLGCALGGTSQVVQAGMKAKRVADVGLRIGQVGSKIKNSKYVANAGKHIISVGKQIKNSKFIVNSSKKLAQCGN